MEEKLLKLKKAELDARERLRQVGMVGRFNSAIAGDFRHFRSAIPNAIEAGWNTQFGIVPFKAKEGDTP